MSEQFKNKTVLGADCTFHGELSLDNDAVILGQIDGVVRVSGSLDLPETARVRGTVIAGTLRIAGHVEADVIGHEAVHLVGNAVLSGRLISPRVSIAEGVTFVGQSCVGPEAPEAARRAEAALKKHTTPPAPAAPTTTEQAAPIDDDLIDTDPAQLSIEPGQTQQLESLAQAVIEKSDQDGGVTTIPASLQHVLKRRKPRPNPAVNMQLTHGAE